jgi:predicted metal-dependent hydrolase
VAPIGPRRYRIRHDDGVIEYDIVHRPAVTRRIHLQLGPDGHLQVVAPRRMSARQVRKTLERRSGRVARFLEQARARRRDLPVLRYVSGERHGYLGRQFPLDIGAREGRRDRVELADGRLLVRVAEERAERVRALLQGWYREQALAHFGARLRALCKLARWCGDDTPELRVRRMKRTWGNCSTRGRITLNTALIKAPPEMIDYVICHEICHLHEHNHGPAFYALQEKIYPRWREMRQELRANGHILLHD